MYGEGKRADMDETESPGKKDGKHRIEDEGSFTLVCALN